MNPGTYVAAYGDHYDATRILLPELAWQLQLSGNPVTMIPTRDCMVITGDSDETGQSLMLAMAQAAIDETTRHLSPEVFRLEGPQWTPSCQPVGPCAAEHRKLVLMFFNGYYESQKTTLDQANALNKKDVFVASYKAMQKANGELFTFAALTHRLPTLLPEVELVALMDAEASHDSPPVVVPWKVFHDELGAELERLGYVLPRYSANFDPSAELMERLRQQAVGLG